MADAACHTQFGAPSMLSIDFELASNMTRAVDIVVTLFNKTATRLPEAMWLSAVKPTVSRAGVVAPLHVDALIKLGSRIDPTNIVLNG